MYESRKKQTNARRKPNRLRIVTIALAIMCAFGGSYLGFWIANSTAEKSENLKFAPEVLSASFVQVAQQVEPAVVNIDTKTNAPQIAANNKAQPQRKNKEDEEDSSILEYFRKQLPLRPSYSTGSGFIVDSKGYILTNYHVIEDTNRITVRLESGEEYIADVIGVDEETDIAVLKIDAGRDLPTVKLGDSKALQVGDWVLAIGSPFGLDQTVTAGIVSKVERETPSSGFQKFIQTDAAINRGNSGGPLVNMKGEVIGVNSQIATSTGDYNGIGFALPSNEATYVYNQILQNGKVKRGFLGVTLDSLKPEFAKVYNSSALKGAIITNFSDEKGPAALAGLQENDIITKFNGQSIANAQDLISKVASTAPDQKIETIYLRDVNDKLEERKTTITLGERPALRDGKVLKLKSEKSNAQNEQQLGIAVTELTTQLVTQNKLNGQTGVLVKDIDPNGIIADVKIPGRESAVSKMI
jgi:serine protease Do